jgi:hypothetical protein
MEIHPSILKAGGAGEDPTALIFWDAAALSHWIIVMSLYCMPVKDDPRARQG